MPNEEKPSSGTGEKKDLIPDVPSRDSMNMDTVFYYSREHRLGRASASVQEFNSGKNIRPSVYKSLFGARGNRFLLLTIILAVSSYGIATRISSRSGEFKLGGNTLTAEIIREEGILTLSITKNSRKNPGAYCGPVDMAVSPVMKKSQEIPPVFTQRIFFSELFSEDFSFVLPFDGANFFIVLRTDEEQKSIKLTALESKK